MVKELSVLVTGASGFIATQTIFDLLEAGHRVRGSLRSLDKADDLRDALREQTPMADMLECVEADLTSDTGWEAAVDGCDVVLHMASPFPPVLPKRAEEIIEPARNGALRVLKAAAQKGVKRVVMTSSAAAISYGREDELPDLLTEADWTNPENLKDNSAYTRSKTLAERAAWEFAASAEGQALELVSLNPALVLGPVISPATSASLEVVTQLLTGKMPALPHLNFPIVDVRDVAKAHIVAMTHPDIVGQRILLAESNLDLSDIAQILRDAFPDRANRIPARHVPNWMVRLLAAFSPTLGHVLPDLGKTRRLSNQKMTSILGIEPIAARQSVLDAAESLVNFKIV